MDTKRLGNIGEAIAISAFVKYGIPIYLPFGDTEKADLIAEFNGKLNKIQVKTCNKAENGKMMFDLTSCTNHRNNGNRHKYSPDEIDYFFCYNIERNKSFLIKVTNDPITQLTIRYNLTENGQKKNIHMEDELEFDTIIESILNKK